MVTPVSNPITVTIAQQYIDAIEITYPEDIRLEIQHRLKTALKAYSQ